MWTYLDAVRFLDGEHLAVLLCSGNGHHGVCWWLRSGTGEVVAVGDNSERRKLQPETFLPVSTREGGSSSQLGLQKESTQWWY